MSNKIASAFNRSAATWAATFDIYKAFGRVWHAGLFHKVVKSYRVSDRLCLVWEGKSLQEYPLDAGVPQGSILHPTLFLLYINYLPDDVIFNIAVYANDTTLDASVLICDNN